MSETNHEAGTSRRLVPPLVLPANEDDEGCPVRFDCKGDELVITFVGFNIEDAAVCFSNDEARQMREWLEQRETASAAPGDR